MASKQVRTPVPPSLFVDHPRIQPGRLEDREYQRAIAEHARRENVLAILPTGLGKTAIALRVVADRLRDQPRSSVLFLAPTRPLVEQHAQTVSHTLRLDRPPLVFTGDIAPERRQELFEPPVIVVATPQAIWNDVRAGHLTLSPFSLLIFDEAHRAVGDYPYVFLGRLYQDLDPPGRVLGLTASPGAQESRIREVCRNLGIPPRGLELRLGDEPDVTPYLHSVPLEVTYVDNPPELQDVSRLLQRAFERQVSRLRSLGFLPSEGPVTRRDLLELGHRLRAATASARTLGEPSPGRLWEAVTAQAVAMKLSHALELSETQGITALARYFGRVRPPAGGRVSPSARAFEGDPDVRAARERLSGISQEHPKMEKIGELLREEMDRHPDARVIVFAHFRDTAETLVRYLSSVHPETLRPARFVGQADREGGDRGLSQREQAEILERFRRGEINCLVATSVAEEGLDIPQTDLVIFYEPVPSEIRTIQRRGRTGRTRTGRAIVLVSRGTRDIFTHRSSRGKEGRMRDMLERLRGEPSFAPGTLAARGPEGRPRGRPRTLEDFTEGPST
jgi:ERCC4-related helicase